nr:hypothetical protein [Tanacetum cinerariifolium]
MSSASSAVTYTSVYTDSEPRRTPPAPQDEDEHELMFIQPNDPDFVPEPIYPKYIPLEDEHILLAEEQPLPPVPHDPNFVPDPIYPEYIPLEDEHILLAKEQPLPPVVSPTAESLGYVAESNQEEDLEEYEDDETEDGPVNYPMDGGDDDDGDSSGDDADDEDEDEEEEHLALADSVVVIPTDELVAPPEGTEHAVISFPPETEVKRHLSMPTPSPSPLTSLSPPSAGERLARCTTLTILPSPPLPPPLYMPPPTDRKDDIPETEMPPRKRLCLSTLGSRYEAGKSSMARPTGGQGIDYRFVSTLDAEARQRGIKEVRYGIRDTWIDPAETVPEIAPMTVREVNTKPVDLLIEDKIAHQEILQIIKEEAYAAREAWAHSIGFSQVVHSELQTHQDQASGTDGRDSPSDGRHETRDGRHACRVVSTTWIAEESWIARRGC